MPTPQPLGNPLTEVRPIPEATSASAAFSAHVDIIPALVGYPLSNAFVLSTSRSGGRFTHQFGPLTEDGMFSAVERWARVELHDATHVFVAALTEEPEASEELLRQGLDAICDHIGEFATICMVGEPGITAGWASTNEFATMNEEWQLEAPSRRESYEGTLGYWIPGRPLPAQDRQAFLARFKHSDRQDAYAESVPLGTVQKVAADLERIYVDRPDCALLSLEHCSVLQAASVDPVARKFLLSIIDATNAHAWMRIWHATAVRSSFGAVAATYAIAAYVAWVKGEGMNADAYLDYAHRAKDQSPMVSAVTDGLGRGTWAEAALGEVVARI